MAYKNQNSSNRRNKNTNYNPPGFNKSGFYTPTAPKNKAMPNTISKPWSPRPEIKRTSSKSKKFAFIDKMQDTYNTWYGSINIPTLPKGYKYSENGAVMYSTTGKALLDLHFATSSLRNKSDKEIVTMWRNAYSENPRLAIRWLAYTSDIRSGAGERRTSRIIMHDIASNGGYAIIGNILAEMIELGRWDVIYTFKDVKPMYPYISSVVNTQWKKDVWNMNHNKPVSLLAKWLDSANSHVEKTRENGLWTMQMLGLNETQYRKTISMLRKYIDVVERKMSSNNWQAIDYETVPSKANLIYNKAFLKHDEERRRSYLNALTKGEAKINSSVAFPHEIVHKYRSGYGLAPKSDPAIEGMWKALPDLVGKNGGTTIVCRDDSGSMTCQVDRKSSVTALEVATALSIYFAERCKGPYHNTFFSFSETPRIMELKDNWNLHSKLKYCYSHSEVANTNIERLFDLILETAVKNHCSQDEIPSTLLIISDMEMDSCSCHNGSSRWNTGLPATLFDTINKKYKRAGYNMPTLVFWNVNSRTNAMPVREHNGFPARLVSGFSVNTLKMVLSNKTNPWDALVEQLMDKRYDKIEKMAFDN